MARDLRYVPPGSLVEVTCRTTQGRFLLRPSRDLNEIVYGILGRAVEQWPGVGVVAFTFLSSHFHALLVPKDAEALARFMGFVKTNLSKELGRLHDWPGPMWDDRYHSVIVSHEPEAQVERLQYVLGHGVKGKSSPHPVYPSGSVWRSQRGVSSQLGRVTAPGRRMASRVAWLR